MISFSTQILPLTNGRAIAQGGVVVAEHKASFVLEQSYGGINRFSEKRYGDSKVSFYEVVDG